MRWKFVDRIIETDESEYIKGEKTFPLNEDWHQDHFPQSPVIPGVLQIEVIANLVGKLILLRTYRESRTWVAPILLKTFDCRFIDMIRPGEQVEAEAKIEKYTRRIVYSSGTLLVNGQLRAKVSIASARMDVSAVGDEQVLIPWQIRDFLEIYPRMEESMRTNLQEDLLMYERSN